MMIRFSHARDSVTLRSFFEKFISSRAMDAVTTAAIVEIASLLHPEVFEELKESDEDMYNQLLGIAAGQEDAEEYETEAEPAA